MNLTWPVRSRHKRLSRMPWSSWTGSTIGLSKMNKEVRLGQGSRRVCGSTQRRLTDEWISQGLAYFSKSTRAILEGIAKGVWDPEKEMNDWELEGRLYLLSENEDDGQDIESGVLRDTRKKEMDAVMWGQSMKLDEDRRPPLLRYWRENGSKRSDSWRRKTWSTKARAGRITGSKIQDRKQVHQLESAKVCKNKGPKQTRRRRDGKRSQKFLEARPTDKEQESCMTK